MPRILSTRNRGGPPCEVTDCSAGCRPGPRQHCFCCLSSLSAVLAAGACASVAPYFYELLGAVSSQAVDFQQEVAEQSAIREAGLRDILRARRESCDFVRVQRTDGQGLLDSPAAVFN